MKIVKTIILALLCSATLLAIHSCGKKQTDTPAPPNPPSPPAQVKSPAKSITGFSLKSLTPVVNAVIDESAKTITCVVPFNTNLTGLVPTIALSDKASVSPASAAAQDFTKQINYTVTAEDGSTQIYKVTVTLAPGVTKVIDCNNVPSVLIDQGDGVDYSVGCPISLTDSQKLTIDPGVTIQFDGADAGIAITGTAALKMIGTAAKPIILEGKTNTQGAWLGVQIDANNTDNQWQYVTLKNAGAGTNAAGLLISDYAYFLHNTQISIKNCTFTNNKGYGIWDYDNGFNYSRTVFAGFESNTFTQNSNAPLNITIDGIGKLDTKSTYTGNGENYIEVHAKSGLHSNTVVSKLNVPYLIVGSIGLYQRMTVSPGVTFQFYTDAGFNLAGSGTLIANGTSANPISFVGYQSGKGVWLGLSLGNNDPEIKLNYCIIDGAGSNISNSSGCVSNKKTAVSFYPSCNAWTNKPVATNCKITNCGGYGIIYKKGAAISFTGNSYASNTLDNEYAF